MKVFRIFFALYLLALSAIACTDEHAAIGKACAQQWMQAHSNDQHEDETCSPLCVCSCCGSLAVGLSYEMTFCKQITTPHDFIVSIESVPAEITFSVWQPPRLS
jgi:hypothetical protein